MHSTYNLHLKLCLRTWLRTHQLPVCVNLDIIWSLHYNEKKKKKKKKKKMKKKKKKKKNEKEEEEEEEQKEKEEEEIM